MPVKIVPGDDIHEMVPRYSARWWNSTPMDGSITVTESDIAWLLEEKRKAQNEHQFCEAEKARLGKEGNRDAARWYRDLSAEYLKRQRACQHWIGKFAAYPPKDCPFIPRADWRVELAPYFDQIYRELELRGYTQDIETAA